MTSCEGWRSYRSQPQVLASELFRHAVYADHPYGRLMPTDEMVKTYSLEDLQKFYKANYGAQRTRIYVAGRFNADATRKAIDQAFGDWDKGPAVATDVPKPKPQKKLITSDRPGAPQSTIRLGLPVPGPTSGDYVALDVTDSLLGGSFMSRITSNIREQKGYTYSPRSTVQTHYHDAVWVQNADITTVSTGPALDEIYKEIGKLRQTPPAGAELKGIATNMAGTFVLQNSSPRGIITQLSFVDLQGLGDSWLNSYVQNVMAVTPADIQRIAESYLDPNKMTLVVVGDLDKIKDQLAAVRKV